LQQRSLPEKDRGVINIIITQIDRISGFIRQLLTLAHRPEPQLRAISLNDIVRRVGQTIGEQRNHSGVEIVVELTEELPQILGDSDQLQQVLLNLSVNALQAVGGTGRVTLGTRYASEESSFAQGRVEAVVTYRLRIPRIICAPTTFLRESRTNGTGLGLAISREIVLNHAGDIRVESVPGQGSCFIIFPGGRSKTSQISSRVCTGEDSMTTEEQPDAFVLSDREVGPAGRLSQRRRLPGRACEGADGACLRKCIQIFSLRTVVHGMQEWRYCARWWRPSAGSGDDYRLWLY
jgi:hypothetical protein